MTKAILVVATHSGIGLTSSVMGLYHALDRKGIKVGFFKPVMQYAESEATDVSHNLMLPFQRAGDASLSIRPDEVQHSLDTSNVDELMENLIQRYDAAKGDADVVIMEGLLETAAVPYANEINLEITRSLNADVIIASSAKVEDTARLQNQVDYAADSFGGYGSGYGEGRLLGAIINYSDAENGLTETQVRSMPTFSENFPLLGVIPHKPTIAAARVSDLCEHLNAKIILPGDMEHRRIHNFVMFARSVRSAHDFLRPNNCVFCPGDRDDALMAVTLAAVSGTKVACLILTGETSPSKNIFELCKPLLEKAKLPVLYVETSSWGMVERMKGFNKDLAVDDHQRMAATQEYFAEHIKYDWVDRYLKHVRETTLSPASFRYQIVKRATAAKKRIVLPEGCEPRTVAAVAQISARGIAHCVMLAEPEKVKQVADKQGVTLGDNVTIIDPLTIRDNYIEKLVELRKHKGMNETLARTQLEDNVMLGTMMLELDEVDGLVSGAINTTANTMRPPLQIIKTAPNAKMVSSVFFMALPDKVMVYGDCAIVPRPNAEELAQIAIQSNDTAKSFGIEPKVALISYSTGSSGTGEEVEKVIEATKIVKQLRPDIIVDGPLQYDAAAVASVGEKKAPGSPVAGKATVFIFPDLNTGNTTYKAVQRSANAVSMGPVLQGMKKPVNDLSRGALIDDIIYTIAITAVQASQTPKS